MVEEQKFWKTNTGYTLRWIGILPIGVACYFLAHFLVKLVGSFSARSEEGDFNLLHLFLPGIAVGIAAYAFVYIGTAISPSHKKIVGMILLIFVILFSGMVLFVLIARGFEWDYFLEGLGQIIGGVIAFFQIDQEEKEKYE